MKSRQYFWRLNNLLLETRGVEDVISNKINLSSDRNTESADEIRFWKLLRPVFRGISQRSYRNRLWGKAQNDLLQQIEVR